MSANVETMAYVGETPWHGLGTKLPERPTVEQVVKAAALTWEPELFDLRFTFNGKAQAAPMKALTRNDTGDVLDIVGPRYVPIKNREVVEFFREYCEAGDLSLHTAGALDGGKRIWALAKMEQGFTLPGKDRVDGYVLLSNPHLYGKGAVAKFTAVRVVCHNTLQAALSQDGERVTIWHTAEFNAERRATVQEQLGLARAQLDSFQEDAELLAATQLPDTTARRLTLKALAADPEEAWEEQPSVVKRVWDLYRGEAKGAALPSATSTAWGLFNAVTQHVDWERGRTANNRVRSAWFGSGGRVKRQAHRVLVDYAQKRA